MKIEDVVHKAYELSQTPDILLALEHELSRVLKEVAEQKLPQIESSIRRGFDKKDLFPFWSHYAPKQRGRNPIGDNIPSGDLGEKVVGLAILSGFLENLGSNSFLSPIGFPFGGDYRWITAIKGNPFVLHLDIKATGPRDNPNELVVPATQVTGYPDELTLEKGEFISVPLYVGAREPLHIIRPALSPIVPFKEKFIPQLTAFIKFVYRQESGAQLLDHLKIAIVPNGILLLSPSPYYKKYLQSTKKRKTPFNKGKDDEGRRSVAREGVRFRILLPWLSSLDREGWRVTTLSAQ